MTKELSLIYTSCSLSLTFQQLIDPKLSQC